MSGKTKKIDGVDLHSGCFAYVGDVEDTSTWKLPILILGNAQKTLTHVKSALARFDQTKGIPDAARPVVWGSIWGAALMLGLKADRREFPRLLAGLQLAEEVTAIELAAKPHRVDRELAQLIADADRKADEMLKRLGLE